MVTAVSLSTGFYRMCFGNHNNQFGGIRVFLNFGVIYEGFEESKRDMEEGQEVLNSTLAGIEVFVSSLWGLCGFGRSCIQRSQNQFCSS